MLENEKGQPKGHPNPISVVYHEATDNKASPEFAQALACSVFGRGYVVVHAPIGDNRFRKRAPSRIRAWRAQ